MLLVVDPVSIDLILPIMKCYATIMNAVHEAEVLLTKAVLDGGYDAETMMQMLEESGKQYGDIQFECAYDGSSIHAYDTLFVKTKRFPNEKFLGSLTKWAAQKISLVLITAKDK